MEINITPEMIEAARKKKEASEALVRNMNNDDPSEPQNICIGCE